MSSSSNLEYTLTGAAAAPVRLADRLSSMLFLAVLAHGIVILGVTFTAGPAMETDALPSLNVTLVVNSNELAEPPENSELLAESNQQGGGRAAEGIRPTTTLAADQAITQAGDAEAADLVDGKPREQAVPTEQIVTRSEADERIAALPKAAETASATSQTAAALIDRDAAQTLAMEIDTRAEMPTSDDRDILAAPSTQESMLASYLDGWRKRVERIGTVNFPARFRADQGYGRPTLEVAIAADGELAEIVVRRSSGNAALDQAAISILRMAAPFEPLPDSIKSRYDVLRFAYEWEFTGGTAAAAPATGSAAP